MDRPWLGPWTGTGMVVANMIGAGVFLSAGFMAQDLTPGQIMLAWLVGLGIALLGTVTYGSLAGQSGHSGGEYRYLSDTLHPWAGHLAGWGSLIVGFATPVAIDVLGVGLLLQTVWPALDPRLVGTGWLIVLTLVHGLRLDLSRAVQNALVALKIALVLGFVCIGLALGSHRLPTWQPANVHDGFPFAAFVSNLYWVAFAFSGWNAAVYAADGFSNPKRDVPRAMYAGTLLVGALYLGVNAVVVLNLTPEIAIAVASNAETQVTLAHLVLGSLLGPAAGDLVSIAIALVFASAASAMTLVGPHVYAEMARDRVLPAAFAPAPGRPPVTGLLVQSAVALVLLHVSSLLALVQSAGGLLLAFSALVGVGVLVRGPRSPFVAAAAAAYAVLALGLFAIGLVVSRALLVVTLILVVLATLGYVRGRRAAR